MTNLHLDKEQLIDDVRRAIGERDQANERCDERTARYRELAESRDYGDRVLPGYDEDLWFDEAVNEDVRGLRDLGDSALLCFASIH